LNPGPAYPYLAPQDPYGAYGHLGGGVNEERRRFYARNIV